MTIDWQPLCELLAKHKSFILTSHCRADCDAIGSEIGLALILEALGKQVTIVNGDAVPEHIAFMDPDCRVKVLGEDIQADELQSIDALIVVDTSAWVQLGPMAEVVKNFSGQRIVIDHHVSQDDLGAELFKEETAEATGRLILELGEALGVTLTPEIAKPLFTAIATDTGWFRFSSVTEKTFSALARIVAAGVRPPEVFSALYEQHSLPRLYLRGRILDHVQSDLEGRLLSTHVTIQDFEETNAKNTDTEDAINMLLSVATCDAAAMFVELEEAKTKVSLRSRGGIDVQAVASQFGGGGHKAASGISMACSIQDAQKQVIAAMIKAMS